MNYREKMNNLLPVVIVGPLYMIAFTLLEQRQVPVHIIQGKMDAWIPFCEYFIVPYLLWFVYVAATVLYFACFNRDKVEYKRLLVSLFTGMVVFLIISYIYPNGQNLRPVLAGDNFFELLVLQLYATDTPTNILPSLHVFYSVVCCIALASNTAVSKHRTLKMLIYILTFSIVLSTMFLKQHSIIDVVMALLMNGCCYHLFYQENQSAWRSRSVRIHSRQKRKGVEL